MPYPLFPITYFVLQKVKKFIPSLLPAILLMFATGCSSILVSKRTHAQKSQESAPEKTTYEKITGSTDTTQKRLRVFRHRDDYYYDIPRSLMGRDFLIVNRVLSVPPELNESGINRGTNYENTLVRFELDPTKKNVYVREVKPLPHYPERDNIGQSVVQNYVSPLIAKLKVETMSSDSAHILVKVTNLYDGSSTVFNNLYQAVGIGGSPSPSLSTIIRSKSFEDNVTIVSDLTTSVREGASTAHLTVRVASSLIVLPQEPMQVRYLSERVGYFSVPQKFFADRQTSVETKEIITRWRLEPKDKEAYLRGELVEPLKPIVFYIDKSTPEQWRPYIKKGIEDWQKAFEAAGFKHAIVGLEIPDSLDRDDLRYSGINYVASEQKNAMGPSVYDPRSGEIIQADIMWWHNVLSMLRTWIILQTGATQAKADVWTLPTELLGEAMRFVATHEVGHSLGLRHNMIASHAYTIAQLRDPVFTSQNGTSPSIMDYARFNYVAQPEDGVTQFAPQIGPYDIFAIQYGYRWYGDGKGQSNGYQDELQKLLDAHNGEMYLYSEAQDSRSATDPRAQTEDLSNDPVEASTLGIANLKRILPKLAEITYDPAEGYGYTQTGLFYQEFLAQWNTYLYHPLALIGGIYINPTDRRSPTPAHAFVSAQKQREALRFILKEAVTDVEWLFETTLLKYTYPLRNTPNGRVESAPSLIIKNAQSYVFWDLLDNRRLIRMSENVAQNGKDAFSPYEMTDMLYRTVFEKSIEGKKLSMKDRFVEKGLVDALLQAASSEKASKSGKGLAQERNASAVIRELNFYGSLADRISDAISIKRELLERIQKLVNKRKNTSDPTLRGHYLDLSLRIEKALK